MFAFPVMPVLPVDLVMQLVSRRYLRGLMCLHSTVHRCEFEMDFECALQILVESLRLTRIALGRVRACRDFGAEAGDD